MKYLTNKKNMKYKNTQKHGNDSIRRYTMRENKREYQQT